MLHAERHPDPTAVPSDFLLLTYDVRKRSRVRTRSHTGYDVAIVLPRGSALRDGDLLLVENGVVLAVRAAPEAVSEARTPDPLLLTRAAYHLGNRHVPLQVEAGVLRYQHDHVLDDMVMELGLAVEQTLAPFEPEGGAYAQSGGHGQTHGHAHGHGDRHGGGHAHDEELEDALVPRFMSLRKPRLGTR